MPLPQWRKLTELESRDYESGGPREATAAATAAAGAGAAISFAGGEGQDGEGTRSPNPSSEGLQAPPGQRPTAGANSEGLQVLRRDLRLPAPPLPSCRRRR